jgi:hypothetical protein
VRPLLSAAKGVPPKSRKPRWAAPHHSIGSIQNQRWGSWNDTRIFRHSSQFAVHPDIQSTSSHSAPDGLATVCLCHKLGQFRLCPALVLHTAIGSNRHASAMVVVAPHINSQVSIDRTTSTYLQVQEEPLVRSSCGTYAARNNTTGAAQQDARPTSALSGVIRLAP